MYHKEKLYVNLEDSEGLLQDSRVLCDENADFHKPTEVVLRFNDQYGFELARSQWNDGEGLIFAVEDPHCFHPDGDRSFYLAHGINWDEANNIAVIRATPQHASIFAVNSEWATRMRHSLMEVPPGYFADARPSSGVQSYLDPAKIEVHDKPSLFKRDRTAAKLCIKGLLTPGWNFGFLGTLERCALGAPLTRVIEDVMHNDDTSKHIKAGWAITKISPLLGCVIAGLGTLVAPTTIAIGQEWNYHWENKTFSVPWGIDETNFDRKLPHATVRCPGCHATGKFEASLKLDFDLLGRHHKGPNICTNSDKDKDQAKPPTRRRSVASGQKLPHEVWLEVHRKALHHHRAEYVRNGLKKRDVKEISILHDRRLTRPANHDHHFGKPKCDPHDETFPECNLGEVIAYHKACDFYLDNTLLHPSQTIAAAFKCLAKTFGGQTDCWQQFHEDAGDFKGPKDFLHKFIVRHMDEASFEMEVKEEINLKVQGELDIALGGGMWIDLDFPIEGPPKPPSWGYFVSMGDGAPLIINGAAKTEPGDRNGKPYPLGYGHSNHGLGRIEWGVPAIRLEQVISASFQANLTLPGLAAKISPGKFKVDLLKQKGDMAHGDVLVHLEYLDADIEMAGDPSFSISWSVGPAFNVNLTPWMFLPPPAEKWTDIHGHLEPPLAFGGQWDFVRIDLQVGLAPADHEQCKEHEESQGRQWTKNGWFFGVFFRTGIKFYGSIFGQRFDTASFGKLQDAAYAINGFYWSDRLHLKCTPLDDGESFADHVEKRLKKVLRDAQKHIKEAVEKLNAKLQALSSDRPRYKQGDMEFFCGPKANGTFMGWEAFVGYHNIHAEKDPEVYIPRLIPETTAECEADQAATEHINGTLINCKNITTPGDFNLTEIAKTAANETTTIGDIELCHLHNNCTG